MMGETAKMTYDELEEAYISAGERIAQLEEELKYIGELTGIAGVDEPMSIPDCVRALKMENKQWADEFVVLNKRYEDLERERDALAEGFQEIIQWCNAYPLSVLPEPNLKKAHELLSAGGITLDAISASAMRHVLKGIVKIIEAPREGK